MTHNTVGMDSLVIAIEAMHISSASHAAPEAQNLFKQVVVRLQRLEANVEHLKASVGQYDRENRALRTAIRELVGKGVVANG